MIKIKAFKGGYDKNFSYLVWCPASREAAVIDPSVESGPVIETIGAKILHLKKILITHSHPDHFSYLNDYTENFLNLTILCFDPGRYPDHIKNLTSVKHSQRITLGQASLIILHTPGHLEDSICIFESDSCVLFTGDTVFVNRTGRTIMPGSSLSDLYNSVYLRILTLPRECRIYPGHDYGSTPTATIHIMMQSSPFFQCQSKTEFVKVMRNYEDKRQN